MLSAQVNKFINYVISNSYKIYYEFDEDLSSVKFKIYCIKCLNGELCFYKGTTEEELKAFYKNIKRKWGGLLQEKFIVQKAISVYNISYLPESMYETYAKILVQEMEEMLYIEINKFNAKLKDIKKQKVQ